MQTFSQMELQVPRGVLTEAMLVQSKLCVLTETFISNTCN